MKSTCHTLQILPIWARKNVEFLYPCIICTHNRRRKKRAKKCVLCMGFYGRYFQQNQITRFLVVKETKETFYFCEDFLYFLAQNHLNTLFMARPHPLYMFFTDMYHLKISHYLTKWVKVLDFFKQ